MCGAEQPSTEEPAPAEAPPPSDDEQGTATPSAAADDPEPKRPDAPASGLEALSPPKPGRKKARFSETLWFKEGDGLDDPEEDLEGEGEPEVEPPVSEDPEALQQRYTVEEDLDPDSRRRYSLDPDRSSPAEEGGED